MKEFYEKNAGKLPKLAEDSHLNQISPYKKESNLPEFTYEIWREGYRITGNTDTAQLLGVVKSPNKLSWIDAVKQYELNNCCQFDWSYGDGIPRTWGCRLFDNEADARKSFG